MYPKLIIKNGLRFIGRHAPEFLTGVGICGVALTAFLTGRASLIADQRIKELEAESGTELTFKEKAKVSYRYYIPAVVAGLGTMGSIITARKIGANQVTTALALASKAEETLKDNERAIVQTYGEDGLREIEDQANLIRAHRYSGQKVYETGQGTVLICESFTGHWLRATPEWVHRAVNLYNKRLIDGEALCYNEFLEMLIPGIETDHIDIGQMFGYNLNVRRRLLELVETHDMLTTTREPYMVIGLRELPLLDYMNARANRQSFYDETGENDFLYPLLDVDV